MDPKAIKGWATQSKHKWGALARGSGHTNTKYKTQYKNTIYNIQNTIYKQKRATQSEYKWEALAGVKSTILR